MSRVVGLDLQRGQEEHVVIYARVHGGNVLAGRGLSPLRHVALPKQSWSEMLRRAAGWDQSPQNFVAIFAKVPVETLAAGKVSSPLRLAALTRQRLCSASDSAQQLGSKLHRRWVGPFSIA